MKTGKILRRIALIISFLMLITSTVGTTYGFIVTSTDSLITVFLPDEIKDEPINPDNVTVGGIKLLEGREWQAGDSFTFVLEMQDGEEWTRLGEKTVSYSENEGFNKFDFSDVFRALSFDKVGTYTFRMTEEEGTLENVQYDNTVNYFTVTVADDNGDGKLEISSLSGTQNVKVTAADGAFEVVVSFKGVFTPEPKDPDPITVQIGIDKNVDNVGQQSVGREGFEFVLELIGTEERIPAVSDESGKATLFLSFDKKDVGMTYSYRLFESDKGMDGMTYDKKVYEITVSVSLDNDGRLVAALTLDGNETDALSATFNNVYDSGEIVSPPTGDNGIIFWLVMMVVSGATFVSLLIYEKKRAIHVA